jgi:hypothetical protein
MLRGNQRFILYFDLAMAPHPSDAPALPLADFIPYLQKRQANDLCFQVIDNERRVVRLSALKEIKLAKNGNPAVALLFSLGDRDKADPGFTNFITGKVRIPKRGQDEADGLSVHAVIALKPTQRGGHLYRMVYEDVPGFGRSLIQGFLRSEFKIIADDQGLTFKREGSKDDLKTRPMVEISGHASDKLKDSIQQGRLLHIELINYKEKNLGFDEAKFISSVRRDMSLSIAKALPQGNALKFLERVKEYAKKNDYEAMRVRWREPQTAKALTAKVDTARSDAGEALFVKFAEVKLRQSLPDICDTISDELISKIKDFVG